MRSRQRPAFTLIQLLVVVALLAMLFGLLFPAIFKVRQAASRLNSQNNLKQIAVAALNYESAFTCFPPGSDKNHLSAYTRLLPYLEQAAAYQQIDFTKEPTDEANAAVRKMHFEVFVSPRDPQQVVKENFGPTNYVLCAGAQVDMKDNDGIFFQESKIRIPDITDGTSNTIMIGETLKGDGGARAVHVRRQHVALGQDALKGVNENSGVEDFRNNKHIAGDRCASWMDGHFLQSLFNGTLPPNDARPDVNCEGQGGASALRSLDQTVHVGFGDGSVRAINKKIGIATWKALCTRSGGEVINQDF